MERASHVQSTMDEFDSQKAGRSKKQQGVCVAATFCARGRRLVIHLEVIVAWCETSIIPSHCCS